MGFGDPDQLDGMGGGAAVAGIVESPAALVPCSICLDAVTNGGERSTAKLQCGHQFHLDCIGSAFNAKGLMQCPNCRKVEKGNWLFASGYRPIPDLNMDDWMHDEDLYDLNYPEMPFGVHWCPFSRLARIPFSFEEGEFSPPFTHHDLVGQHAVFAEHPTAATSATHPCPYVSYFQPLQPSSSSGSQLSTEGMIDGSTFHHHWNSLSGPIDISNSHVFPAIDARHQSWDSHSPPSSRVNGAEQASISSSSVRSGRVGSDPHPRPMYMHSFVIGQGSSARASSSGTSSTASHFIGNSRGHTRNHEHHGSYQHQHTPGMRGPILSGARRPGSTRALAPIGPAPSPTEQTGFYLFSPAASTSRNQDSEVNGGSHFYAWERDRLAPFPLLPVDRELSWWGPVPQASSGSESSNQARFWPRHGSDRPPSQSRPPHHPRMHPFI